MLERTGSGLRIDGLCKRIHATLALRNIALEVAAGEVVTLLGPNGAGKTSLMMCIQGAAPFEAGDVLVAGHSVRQAPLLAKAMLGIQLQATSLLTELRVIDQLRLIALLYRLPAGEREISARLAQVGLSQQARQYPATLSGGEKQRLTLAMALVNDPQVLILDEPTVALDIEARRDFWALVAQLKQAGKAILMSTHNIDEAAQLSDRVAVLNQGAVIALGTPDELMQHYGAIRRIEVQGTAQPADLAALDGCGELVLGAGQFTVHTADMARALEVLGNIVRPHQIKVLPPSLEHIILQITQRAPA